MKFAIQSKGDHSSEEIKKQVEGYLTDFHLQKDEEEPDIVISIGGDGTLLYAFHRYSHRLKQTAFVGIHTGHLGFYADWMPTEVEKLVIAIAKSELEVVEYPLLDISISYKTGQGDNRYLALNECTMKSTVGTFVLDVEIRGRHFETFRGDGLCVSTPSGSTAYNKALGGAIIHPYIEAIQITEMASINNRVFRTIGSSLVLPKHHNCVMRPVNPGDLQITVDHIHIVHEDVKSMEFRVADEKVRFARFRPFPFWKRVQESFVTE